MRFHEYSETQDFTTFLDVFLMDHYRSPSVKNWKNIHGLFNNVSKNMQRYTWFCENPINGQNKSVFEKAVGGEANEIIEK